MNFGQGGYGLDQSYLQVMRDAANVHFDVLLFAFVRNEFARMEKDEYHHYGKPLLRIGGGGELEVRNVPVPNNGERVPWLVRNLSVFERLRVVELARPAIRAVRRPAAAGLTAGELADLSGKVFEELKRFCNARGAVLVLIDMPTYADYENSGEIWRTRIAREAHKRGIPFIDLVEEMRTLPRNDVARLYEPIEDGGPRGSETPFSEAGHAWVAETLHTHLRRLPELAGVLGVPHA
jgi:hypothetical protein